MASTSFAVSMVLEAVNRMGPGVQAAVNSMQQLRQSIANVTQYGNSVNPVKGWDAKIDGVIQRMQNMRKQMEDMDKAASNMRHEGFENVATGAAIGAPVFAMIDEAASREKAMMVLSQAGMGEDDRSAINEMARKLSSELMFSQNELLSIPLAMQRAGMNADKIKVSYQQTAYLAELEHLRNGAGAAETAKNFASMAEQVQATSDPQKLNEFAEAVNRVATVTSASISTLAESTKYFAPVAKMYGLGNTDVMLTQGFMARYGIEGSMAGTHLKDFLDRLNPEQFLKSSGKSQQLEAMEQLGFLDNAQFTKMKKGGLKFTDVGDSVFFKEGKIKPVIEIFDQLGKKYQEMIAADPEHGLQKYAAAMKHIFGEQGKDVAMIAAQNHEAFTKMLEDYNRVKRIDDSVHEFQQTFSQTFGAMKTNLQNIGVDAVESTMKDLTKVMKDIAPYVDRFANWAKEHPELVTTIVKMTLGLAAFLITLGAARIILGTVAKLMLGGLRFGAAPLRWAMRLVKSLMDMRTYFQVLRLSGAGFWKALSGGAKTAWPWLSKISKWVSSFAGRWIVMALRVAAGWLIAMGPVGWVILGVTIIIGAAVWAWKTNFMGFQDWVKKMWEKFTAWAQPAIDKVGEYISKALQAVGLSGKLGGSGNESKVHGSRLNESYVQQAGGNSSTVTVTQNNSVTVASAQEAGEYTQGALGKKYELSLGGPQPAFTW